jgi:ectoine hydroxylase
MLPEKILEHAPLVLTNAQREFFFEQGYLALPDFVPKAQLDELVEAQAELVEQSRSVTQSNEKYVLEDGHTAAQPRLHRIVSPQDHHPAFWSFMCDPLMTDLAADVVGPDVRFHHAKLNVKAGAGSRGFKWHQDIQAWPHTDYSPVTVGVYLQGCKEDQGPLAFVPGSHKGKLYSMYDDAGEFVVRIRDEEIGWLSDDMTDAPVGGPGTVLLLNCRTIHGSRTNRSTTPRPLLLSVYSSADSFAYTPSPITSPHMGDIVRGRPAQFASFDPRPCELPPDWRAGYKSAWVLQKGEEGRKQHASLVARM